MVVVFQSDIDFVDKSCLMVFNCKRIE